MKWFIVSLFFIIPVALLFYFMPQYEDFKYKGELPTTKFSIKSDKEPDIRNRVYVMIDESTGELTLNNRKISSDDFEEHFKYVLSNTDKHNHLPESPEKVVLYTNITEYSNTKNEPSALNEFWFIIQKASDIYFDMLTSYQDKPTNELTPEEITAINISVIIPLAFPVIETEKGEEAKEKVESIALLPAPTDLKRRNTYLIEINRKNTLSIREDNYNLDDFRSHLTEFITNPTHREDFSNNPENAVIILKKDEETSMDFYKKICAIIRTVYNEIWEEEAQRRYGQGYRKLDNYHQQEIREMYPKNIGEVTPTGFGTIKCPSIPAPPPPPPPPPVIMDVDNFDDFEVEFNE